MGNLSLLTLILILGCLQAFAFSRQRRHYGHPVPTLPPYCGNVSYTEKGRTHNNFFDIETGKTCRNIESALPTKLFLHQKSFGCDYKIEAFSVEDCNTNNYIEYPFNSELNLVKLNDWKRRRPVCSFRVHYSPLPGNFIHIKFLEPRHNDKSQNVTRARCYNLCDPYDPSTHHYYPHTIQINLNGNDAQNYDEDITLFSTPKCDYYDSPNTRRSRIGEVRNGDDLVALTSKPFAVVSYGIEKF